MYNPDRIEETLEEREEEAARYKGLAKIALPRFSESQKREHIGREEILDRLKKIQKTYSLTKGYRKMERGQLWDLLKETRAEIRINANEYCPGVVREIDERNYRQMRGRNSF